MLEESRNTVSVIIPNFNYGQYLSEAIDSVLNQTHQDIEVLVVDDGSTDDSSSILKSYGTEIRVIYQKNSGQSVARNRGILESRGEIVAFLDADDYWEHDKIQKQLELFGGNRLAVYSSIFVEQNQDQEIVMAEMRGLLLDKFYSRPGFQLITGGESSLLLQKSIIAKAGLFNSNLSICAGYDFYRRVAMHTEFDFVAKPLVHYRRHKKNISLDKARYRHELRIIQSIVRSELSICSYTKYKVLNTKNICKDYLKTRLGMESRG
jgi:glycosyltransferase involved in cell wall biosynthesis